MLMALALVIGTTTLLATNVNPNGSNKIINSQIQKLLSVTDFQINENATIKVEFTFDSAGEIIVLKVDSMDRNVLNYIRENLNHKTISNPGVKDRHYTIPLVIKKGN